MDSWESEEEKQQQTFCLNSKKSRSSNGPIALGNCASKKS